MSSRDSGTPPSLGVRPPALRPSQVPPVSTATAAVPSAGPPTSTPAQSISGTSLPATTQPARQHTYDLKDVHLNVLSADASAETVARWFDSLRTHVKAARAQRAFASTVPDDADQCLAYLKLTDALDDGLRRRFHEYSVSVMLHAHALGLIKRG